MKYLFSYILAAILLLASAEIASARVERAWSYQEILDKSDLVVIATPTAANDTKEQTNLSKIFGQPAIGDETIFKIIGVETKFKISAVLKGDKAIADFTLHHYRYGSNSPIAPNSPEFISFDPAKKQAFLIFLVREADGRYASAFGQLDPGFAIHDLGGNIE